MRPSAVEDGSAALQALASALDQNNPFQIALADMNMPGMTGEELGGTITADKRFAQTQLALMKPLGDKSESRPWSDFGFAACLTKPIRYHDLRALLSGLAQPAASTAKPKSSPIQSAQGRDSDIRDMFAARKLRVLVVDDNSTNQQVALGVLKKLGVSARAASDGAEALAVLTQEPFHLVFMDVHMPGMDGLEATRLIRIAERDGLPWTRNRRMPIIAMTAAAMQQDRDDCILSGMDDHVAKPISPREMANTINKWLPVEATAEDHSSPALQLAG